VTNAHTKATFIKEITITHNMYDCCKRYE